MNFPGRGLLVAAAALALAGCAQNGTTGNGPRTGAARTAQNNPNATRRTITGSNVPQPVNRPTFSETSANVPSTSFSRDPDSLVPTEPVVGAGGQSNYRLQEGSTGAGPAGSVPDAGPVPKTGDH